MDRREFLQLLVIGYTYGFIKPSFAQPKVDYEIPYFGNIRLIHLTDTHSQLNPVYFREPNFNIGVGTNKNQPPHIVGDEFLKYYSVDSELLKYAFTAKNFNKLARRYGKFGGYAYLKTVVDNLRSSANGNSLLLDGGDAWQGSAVSLFEKGNDMVEASNILGVDIMTGHWEYTYGEQQLRKNITNFLGDFIAHNVKLTEEAIFDEIESFDGNYFHKPYTIREINNVRVAVIGQAFPYTPIANPRYFVSNLTFGIQQNELQDLVKKIKSTENVSLIILLSHNGVDVDKKLAKDVSGIDVILGGHTHDVLPLPVIVQNANSKTLVINSGCNGKFISVLDLDIKRSGFEYRYKLLPILSDFITPSKIMINHIEKSYEPYKKELSQVIGKSNMDLYRRGTFNGSFDQLICESMVNVLGSDISLSPGFRWGPSVLANDEITMNDIYNQTAITYPNTYRREFTGETIKNILEDVADNIFNPDPYMQQGGDMVRTTGLSYTITPQNKIGQRISNLRDKNGKHIESHKKYMVSGWASVNQIEEGKPIWEIMREYLQNIKIYEEDSLKQPKIKGESDNIGIET